jgi:hypothetical protein
MLETHPQNRRLGYARVSAYGQTLDAQLEQLHYAGCTNIYRLGHDCPVAGQILEIHNADF